MLAERMVDVVFAGGVDERRDDRLVEPGRLIRAQNVRYDKEFGLRHRQGNILLATTSDGVSLLQSGRGALMARKDELVCVDGASIHGYSPDKGEFSRKDAVTPVSLTQHVISGGTRSNFSGDVASIDGTYVGYVWSDTGVQAAGTAYYSVRSQSNGNESTSGQIVMSGGYLTRIAAVGSGFVIAFVSGANIDAYLLTPPGGAGTWTRTFLGHVVTDNKVVAGVGLPMHLSVATAGHYVITYQRQSDGHIVARRFNGGSVVDSMDFAEAGVIRSIRHSYTSGEYMYVLYRITTGDWRMQVLHDGIGLITLGSPVAATSLLRSDTLMNLNDQIAVTRWTSNQCAFAFGQRSNGVTAVPSSLLSFGQSVISGRFSAITNVASGVLTTWWSRLASDIFVTNGKAYAWLVSGVEPLHYSTSSLTFGNNQQGQLSAFLVDLQLDANPSLSVRPVAQSLMRLANSPSGILAATVPSAIAVSSVATVTGGFVSLLSDLRALTGSGTVPGTDSASATNTLTGRYNYSALTASFTVTNPWFGVEVLDSLVLSGGVPSAYDGVRLGECGFSYQPEMPAIAPGGVGVVPTGDNYYVYTYVYVDSAGQTHESQPSQTYYYLAPASKTAVHTLPSYCMTVRAGDPNVFAGSAMPVSINVYRSTQASPSGPFYLVSNDTSRTYCQQNQESVTFTDNLTDAALANQPQLYTGRIGTQSTILDNVAPPALSQIVEHKGRLFGLDPTGKNLWFTKLSVPTEATGSKWADEFTIPHTGPGVFTGITSLDDKLVVFTDQRIYVLYGDGPTDGLLNNDYVSLTRISSDVGCIQPNSLLADDEGVYFMSPVGIYLLTRGLSLEWIGRDIQTSVLDNQTITYAVMHPSQSYMLMGGQAGTPSAGSGGVRFVWDTNVHAWGFDNLTDIMGNESGGQLSAIRLNDRLYWMDTSSAVYVEDSTGSVFTDNGAFVAVDVELAWVKVGGIQGFQRVWRAGLLGDKKSPHDLNMWIGTDYDPSFPQQHVFTWAGNINAVSLEQLRLHIVRQRCQSVKVRIFTTQAAAVPIGSGESLTLQGVTFEAGVYKHMLPTAAGKVA